jgi:hypothetical protein
MWEQNDCMHLLGMIEFDSQHELLWYLKDLRILTVGGQNKWKNIPSGPLSPPSQLLTQLYTNARISVRVRAAGIGSHFRDSEWTGRKSGQDGWQWQQMSDLSHFHVYGVSDDFGSGILVIDVTGVRD